MNSGKNVPHFFERQDMIGDSGPKRQGTDGNPVSARFNREWLLIKRWMKRLGKWVKCLNGFHIMRMENFSLPLFSCKYDVCLIREHLLLYLLPGKDVGRRKEQKEGSRSGNDYTALSKRVGRWIHETKSVKGLSVRSSYSREQTLLAEPESISAFIWREKNVWLTRHTQTQTGPVMYIMIRTSSFSFPEEVIEKRWKL